MNLQLCHVQFNEAAFMNVTPHWDKLFTVLKRSYNQSVIEDSRCFLEGRSGGPPVILWLLHIVQYCSPGFEHCLDLLVQFVVLLPVMSRKEVPIPEEYEQCTLSFAP